MPRGISRLEDLSPRINIIAGPNGAGKSSTARYIHSLLWHQPMSNVISADARFTTDQDDWAASTEGGASSFQKNGIPATPAGLPAKEAKPAYMLALHKLVAAEDKELAAEIMRESIGGYDLGSVKEKLGYSSSIKHARSGEYTAYKNALQEVINIQSSQRTLKRDEERLSELRQKREKADLAKQEEAFFGLYRDYLKARERVQKLDTEHRQFPPSVQKAKEDDLERLDIYEADIAKALEAIQKAKAIIAKNNETISSLKLPEDDIDEATINVLQSYVNDLGRAEKEIAEENLNKTESEARAKDALRGIGNDIDEEAWQGIELPAVHELEKFLLDAYQAYGKVEINKLKICAIHDELESLPESDPTRIIRGMSILQTWLKNEKSFFGIPDTWFYALAGSATIAAIASWLIGWPALIASVVAILALAGVGYSKKPQKTKHDYAGEYTATGLEQPEEWTSPAIIRLLEKLFEELTAAKKREGLQQSLKDLRNSQTQFEQQLEAIREKHDELRMKLHAVPGLPKTGTDNYAGMYHFMIRIKEWQIYHAKAQASNAKIKDLQEKHKSLLDKTNRQFEQFECRLAVTYAEAKVGLDSLQQKVNTRKIALNEIRQQEIILENNKQKKQDAENQRKAIYGRLEVEDGMRHEVSSLVNLLPDFSKVHIDLNHEQRNFESTRKQLQSHALFTERHRELDKLNIESAELKIQDCAWVYAGRDEIVETIKEINLKIDNARESSDMELAMHKRDSAHNDLEALFEQNLAAVTGQLIHDELSVEVREKTMPEVFRRAKSLFNKITGGRYKLIINPSGDGVFMAKDSVLGVGQGLDELSTGTRLQLLLSVRLAYIESREAGLKLPLLADELLANSDDLRASEIIEALIEISRTGRQVFYFTARENEVTNWLAVSKEKQEKAAILRLTGKGNDETAQTIAAKDLPQITFVEQTPEPETLTHTEYGKKLRIPPFDPVNDRTEQLHLWYLTEDNALLYNFLTKGIRFWGQLQSYVNHSGTIAGFDGPTFEKMQQKVQLLKHFCELYRRGRPKKTGVEVLQKSNSVNKNFIERVGKKLKELKGDPQALILALENGAVPRFRASNIEELKTYFIEEGYIDSREVLSDDEIRLQMLAYESQLNIQPDDAESFMNMILRK